MSAVLAAQKAMHTYNRTNGRQGVTALKIARARLREIVRSYDGMGDDDYLNALYWLGELDFVAYL